jgi:hypothetical protein
MTLHEVANPQDHPHLLDGDAENGLDIVFESERNRMEFMELQPHDPKVLHGTDTDDYVAEG